MTKSLLRTGGRLDHAAAAARLKKLGIYSGPATKLSKGNKDTIRRLYNKFSDKLTGNWRAVDVGRKLSRSLSYQGFRQHGSKVLVHTGGSKPTFDPKSKEIRWTYDDGGVRKRKRMLLDRSDSIEKIQRAGRSNQRIGISVGGNASYVTFDAADATAYEDRAVENAVNRGQLISPFFTITATTKSRKKAKAQTPGKRSAKAKKR